MRIFVFALGSILSTFILPAQEVKTTALQNSEMAHPISLEFLTDYLDRTEKDILATVDSLSSEVVNYHPGEHAWTVQQILAHIILAEQAVFAQIKKAIDSQPEQIESLRHHDAWLIGKVNNRGVKVTTPLPLPESVDPLSALRKEFIESRSIIRDYLRQEHLPLRSRYGRSLYGKADCYQLFLIIAAHSMRHHHQMLDNIQSYHSNLGDQP